MAPHFHFGRPRNLFYHEPFALIIFLISSPAPPYMEVIWVQPMPTKRSFAQRDGPEDFGSADMERNVHQKLRKLPHVFSKVLELPFRSDADVTVEEGPDFFRFIVEVKLVGDAIVGDVRAHAVEIHPGVIKVVVRNDHKTNGRGGVQLFLDELDIDAWRFRLPLSTRPELAKAQFVGGELMVTVPKCSNSRQEFVNRDARRGGSKLVLV